MKIKDISIDQRPRERLKAGQILNDAELLALLLGSGTKGESAIDMGNRLISSNGMEMLNYLSLQELMKIKGIGIAKASKLVAAFELSKRVSSGKICEKVVKNPSDIASHYISKLKNLKKEHFIAVFLDPKNKIIKDEVISIGTLNSSLVHPREVFKEAIKCSANSIILVHNHPSGDCKPSEEDIIVTRKLTEAGNLIGIKLLDHLIIGNELYGSLH